MYYADGKIKNCAISLALTTITSLKAAANAEELLVELVTAG
jgi:hypothetical protein